MTHPVDDLMDEARAAIGRMKDAAHEARRLHARAELMRHMRGTAAKLGALPLDDAVRKVAQEWMEAWALTPEAYPDLSAPIARFVHAFCADARGSDEAARAEVRGAISALEAAFAQAGLSLADEMASRSECAHAWWGLVVPRPGGAPFWSQGAPARCGAEPA